MSGLHHNQHGKYNKARACKSKDYAHDTQAKAKAHLERLVARGAFRPMLNIYQCKDKTCLKWHVGHRQIRKL